MKNNLSKIIFSLVGTTVVLWQLLASGYVLTLDMVFGPHVDLVGNVGDLFNTTPAQYLLYFLTTILSGWVAQKIILITIFFLLFYLPLHFFKKIFNIENTYGAEYVASLVFAINPFVYERFLAGQWVILLGYALLVPFTAYLIEFCGEWDYKRDFKLLGIIILIGAISTHIFIMVLIVTALAFAVNFVKLKYNIEFLKKVALLGLIVIACSSYWLAPTILSKATSVSTFGPDHWEVFRTAGGGYFGFGTLGNVLTLHGFWEEHEDWILRFVLIKDFLWFFIIFLILFLSVVVTGIYAGFKDKQLQGRVYFLLFIMFLATVFSCGVGDGIFRNLNMWMFEHISFWRGFRDSEKWSVLLALGYALFAGLGARFMLLYFQKREQKERRIAFYILIAIPLLYTPMMLFGFVGQLSTVWYPNSWVEVNNILKQEKDCKALFLPWQQYYSLKWNNNILTGNVSRSYFDCDIVQGKNMELGSIESQGGNGREYDAVENSVIDNEANPDDTIDLLRGRGVKYIISTDDVIGEDPYEYPFLSSSYLSKVFDRDGVVLYRVN